MRKSITTPETGLIFVEIEQLVVASAILQTRNIILNDVHLMYFLKQELQSMGVEKWTNNFTAERYDITLTKEKQLEIANFLFKEMIISYNDLVAYCQRNDLGTPVKNTKNLRAWFDVIEK